MLVFVVTIQLFLLSPKQCIIRGRKGGSAQSPMTCKSGGKFRVVYVLFSVFTAAASNSILPLQTQRTQSILILVSQTHSFWDFPPFTISKLQQAWGRGSLWPPEMHWVYHLLLLSINNLKISLSTCISLEIGRSLLVYT